MLESLHLFQAQKLLALLFSSIFARSAYKAHSSFSFVIIQIYPIHEGFLLKGTLSSTHWLNLSVNMLCAKKMKLLVSIVLLSCKMSDKYG